MQVHPAYLIKERVSIWTWLCQSVWSCSNGAVDRSTKHHLQKHQLSCL